MNRFLFGALLALVLVPAVSRAADPHPVGAEFILGACATCREQAPAVAGVPSGAFAAVWEGATATDPLSLLTRFFTAQGQPRGAERLVSRNVAADPYDPAVAAGPNGYVVAWSEVEQGKSDIFVQRYKSSGSALGTAIRVSVESASASGSGTDYGPAVAMAANGGFVVAWVRFTPPGGPAIMVRRYDSSGKLLIGQVQISSGLVKGTAPDVCVLSGGSAVVVWDSVNERQPFEPSLEGVSLRRLPASGGPLTGPAEQVVVPPDADAASAAVSCGKGNTFVVAYELDRSGTTDRSDVFAQRFTRQGAPVAGPALRVNTSLAGQQKTPKVSHDAAGNFVVVWTSQEEGEFGLVARRIGAGGVPLSGEVVVELADSLSQRPSSPDVAHAGKTGGFVVTWQQGGGAALGRRYIP